MISLLFVSLVAHAASDKAAVEKDLTFACGLSRMASSLSHTPAFKDSGAELGARVVKALSAGLETEEARNTRKAVASVSGAEARTKLWIALAKDMGLTSWRCPSIGEL